MTQRKTLYFIGIILAVALFLMLRSLALYPTVFADEYTYSKLARLLPFSEAHIPGYLYFSIYRSTNLCGTEFLSCARLLNVIFFVAAAPFIYLVSKKITGEKTALLIAVLSILGPINTYTAYFMPESLYFLTFWIFTSLALSIEQKQRILHWFFSGIVFGLTALIKPHALFLLPALAVYFFVLQWRNSEKISATNRIANYVAFFVAAMATKLAIGFILAGKSGITLFGPGYSSYATHSIADSGRYVELITFALANLQGHILALSLLFSVPLAYLLLSTRYFFHRSLEQRMTINIALYTTLIFAILLVVVALFTASALGTGPYETVTRLHMRYYNFAFPLLFIMAAASLSFHTIHTTLKSRMIVALPVAAVMLYATYTYLNPYTPGLVDNPELRGFIVRPNVFYVLSTLSLFSLALWIYQIRLGANLFVYIFMPLMIIASSFYANRELRHHVIPNISDKAGIFTKHYLASEAISKLVIVGSEPAGLYQSLFHLDNPHASLTIIPKKNTYDLAQLSRDKEWILIIGDHPLPTSTLRVLRMDGFTLVHARIWP